MSIFFDLSPRAKLRVAGTDCKRFLNGQLTNDIRKISDSSAIEACVLNAKGKLNALLFLTGDGDFFLLDTAPELRDALHQRLERYIIADDVQIEDVTDQFSMFHLLGETAPPLFDDCRLRSVNRFGEPGYDIWVSSERHDELFSRLADRFRSCDADCAEILRIERGIPRWGMELTEEIIPIEAHLESQTIDYEKGCYIGQEVISRMKMSGQTNKRLCGLVGGDLTAGMELVGKVSQLRLSDEKEVGWVTSAADSPRLNKRIALGFVKRGFTAVGTKLKARSPENAISEIDAEVVALPFLG
jgi:tRNA-modifying protein YgfZ